MTIPDRPHTIVSALVDGKEEKKDGYEISLVIPSFNSKFPTPVNRVPETLAAKLKLGETYALELEQQNLHHGKSGDLLWHYWWGLVGLAKDGAEITVPATTPVTTGRDATDPVTTRRSIERQVALKAAVELAGYEIAKGIDLTTTGILKVAEAMAQWIAKKDA